MDSIKELRSFCRKQYKIGDKIEFMCTNNGRWERSPSTPSTAAVDTVTAGKPVPFIDDTPIIQNNAREDTAFETGPPPQDATSWSQQPRWVVDLSSTSEAERSVVVCDCRIWSMKECQQHQLKFIAPRKQQKRKQEQPSTKTQKRVNGGRIDYNGISASRNDKNEKRRNIIDNDLNDNDSNNNNDDGGSGRNHHGGGKEKRLQAQELIAFLVKLVGSKVVASNENEEQGNLLPPTVEQRKKHDEMVRDWFNRADGVLDVAGGCGHVSMALGIEGISSTVVDARASVGKLPKRDRKIWKKSLRNSLPGIQTNKREGRSNDGTPPNDLRLPPPTHHLSQYEYCQPVIPAPAVVPFQSQQAWFGSKPVGYDASFRHPDDADIPVLVATAAPKNGDNNNSNAGNDSTQGEHAAEKQTNNNDGVVSLASNNRSDSAVLRLRVSALVALHPDEATGEIVEQAVKHRIPFVVVPCCVFARLFPNRKTKDGRPVSSYEDLLDFLQEQDLSIQRTEMSFGGKNIALWSVFPDG
jgi:hypothetical protein